MAVSVSVAVLPATSLTVAVAVNSPSFRSDTSAPVIVYASSVTSALKVLVFVPSLTTTVTVWPSSTPNAVPFMVTFVFSPLPLITLSAVSCISTVTLALVSLVSVSVFTASLPALSNTLTLTVTSPSASELISSSLTSHVPSAFMVTLSTVTFLPSLSVKVTVMLFVDSTSSTLPLTLTASSSAAFITESSSTSVVLAWVSFVKLRVLVAGLPAISCVLTSTV